MRRDATDSAGAVRPGEELVLDRLLPWMQATIPGTQGEPKVTQYSGGASNWTYRLEFRNTDLILRRPPKGTKAKSAHDMGREYRLQKALAPVFPYVPNMRAHSDDESIIGSEFYVMDRVGGIIPRKNFPRGFELSRDQARSLCVNMLDTLISLHRVDYEAAGLGNIGTGSGYVRRQIEGWSRRYSDARTWNVFRGTRIMRWLADNIPDQETLCITHNDYRLDNIVIDSEDPARVIGVLDWELATIGDPFMDLGNLLAYWIQADDDKVARATRRQPTTYPGMMTRDEVVEHYCDAMGTRPKRLAFYEVYGYFRLSGIAQQIYYRYHHKQSRNPTFKHFWILVNYLHYRCMKIIRKEG